MSKHTPGSMNIIDTLETLRDALDFMEAQQKSARSLKTATRIQDRCIALMDVIEQLEANRYLFESAGELLEELKHVVKYLKEERFNTTDAENLIALAERGE